MPTESISRPSPTSNSPTGCSRKCPAASPRPIIGTPRSLATKWGVRVWNGTLEWLLVTTRPVESLDQALEIVSWYTRRWIVEEFHKAWKTGCRAEERRLTQADRLVPLLGALAIVAVR